MLLSTLVIIHILAAIAAFGANITYFVWTRMALNNPSERVYTLNTISLMEKRYVNPSYLVVGITGLALVDRSGRNFTTPWILLSIVIFLAVTAIGGAVYAPTLRRQIALAEEGDPDSEEYRRLDRRGNDCGAGGVLDLHDGVSAHILGLSFQGLRNSAQPFAQAGCDGLVIYHLGGGDVPQCHAQRLEQRNVVIGLSACHLAADDLP